MAGMNMGEKQEMLRHMTSVLGYARSCFRGAPYRPEPLPTFSEEIQRFHSVLEDISVHLEADDPLADVTPEQLLQGPFADAMTHAGQLALLRRLYGSPIPPENFALADVDPSNVGADQPMPRRPKATWPERL